MGKIEKPGDQVFYKRNLPHWQPKNGVFFITTRLDGSLPKERVLELQKIQIDERSLLKGKGLSEERIEQMLQQNFNLYFGKYDKLLDGSSIGPHWLKDTGIADIWANALNYFDGQRYQLVCSTIMSNHVHFIIHDLKRSLANIMHSLKSFSALEANKVLGREGHKFWQAESFDRVIRNTTELQMRINYVLNNPVKIRLVSHWKEWKYNYIHPDFLQYIN